MKFVLPVRFINRVRLRLRCSKGARADAVIILGCGRSGTSIIGEVFEHLTEFDYLFESHFHEIRDQVKEGKPQRLAIKVPKGGMHLSPGLACDMDELLAILNARIKIVWIVRNPLDTVCSLKPGIELGWRHNPRPPDYESFLGMPWHIQCAHHWSYINSTGYESARRYSEILVIRYEDFVRQPEKHVRRLLAFIGSKYSHSAMRPYLERVGDAIEGRYHAKRQSVWFRPNHSTCVNRYLENTTRNEQMEIWNIVSPAAAAFGYTYS